MVAAEAPFRLRMPALPASWPVYALFIGFPVWWVLGLGSFIWPILAIPMAFYLLRKDRIECPRAFGVWLLFLGWMAASTIELDDLHHALSFLWRMPLYFSATVLILFLCNLTEQELPLRRMVWILGAFWVITATGGLLGVLFPKFQFTSLTELALPRSLTSQQYVHDLVHPGFSQVQGFLGYFVGRPKAPFEYTNEWGANFTLLLPFFVLAAMWSRRRLVQVAAVPLLLISVVPLVYSLNRGVWIALGASLVYVASWLALRGRVWAVQGVLAVCIVSGLLVVASPLNRVVTDRLSHPHSNQRRSFLIQEAYDGAKQSPIFGFGAPRPSAGNSQSITKKQSADCPTCGAPSIGTHGQFWLVLYSHGFPGAALFAGFFLMAFWWSRQGTGYASLAATVSLLSALVLMPLYTELPASLHIMGAAIAVAYLDQRRAGDNRTATTRLEGQPRAVFGVAP